MRSTAKLAVGIAFVALSLGLWACGGKSGGSDDTSASGGLPEPIVIGATSEKTGPVPVLGAEAEGYEAAVDWINSHGGVDGHELEVIIHDNAGDPAKAVTDLRTFAQEGIKLVVGGAFGPDCAAEAPISAEEEMIVFCGSTDNLPEPDDHMFGVGLGYSPTIEAAAEMIAKYSKKPTVFADKDKSGDDSAEEAPKRLKEQGLEPILIRTNPTDASFKAAIQNAIAQGSDGLWFTECTPAAISAVGDAKSLGFKDKIYLENCLGSFEVAEALQQLAGTEQQVLIQVPAMLLPGKAPTAAEQEAIETFEKAVPGPPNLVVGSGWDAIFIIKQLLEQTKTLDVETNLKALEDNFEFTGVWHSGTFTAEDHRGAVAEGYATPAAVTNKGTFEALE
jgi:branched-chain amino acid transport system substrate-binding protein